eukprot:gene8735-6141_t
MFYERRQTAFLKKNENKKRKNEADQKMKNKKYVEMTKRIIQDISPSREGKGLSKLFLLIFFVYVRLSSQQKGNTDIQTKCAAHLFVMLRFLDSPSLIGSEKSSPKKKKITFDAGTSEILDLHLVYCFFFPYFALLRFCSNKLHRTATGIIYFILSGSKPFVDYRFGKWFRECAVRVRSLQRKRTTRRLMAIAVKETIKQVVLSAFPTAHVRFGDASLFECRQRKKPAGPGSPAGGAGAFQVGSASAPALHDTGGAWMGPRVDMPFAAPLIPRAGSRWETLLRHWGLPAHLRRCPTLPPDSAVGAGRPVAVPHAVVLIGGYERVDIMREVAPQMCRATPRSCTTRSSSSGAVFCRTVRDCRRQPSYMRVRQQEHQLRSATGEESCTYLGGDVLELKLACGGAISSVYLSFGNPDLTLAQLLVEPAGEARNRMRSGFGYSVPLLREALPTVAVHAVQLIRSWERFLRSSPLSTAVVAQQGEGDGGCPAQFVGEVSSSSFLVSTLFHVLEGERRFAAMVTNAAPYMQASSSSPGSEKLWALLQDAAALVDPPEAETSAIHSPEAGSTSGPAMAALLSLCTVNSLLSRDAPQGEEKRWRSNFFFPEEHFDALRETGIWGWRSAAGRADAMLVSFLHHLVSTLAMVQRLVMVIYIQTRQDPVNPSLACQVLPGKKIIRCGTTCRLLNGAMGKHKYMIVSQQLKEELVIDEELTVEEIRGVIEAMLDVPSHMTVSITCAGKRVENSMGTWEEAMATLFPDDAANNSSGEEVVRKLYCPMTQRAEALDPSSVAMREVLSSNRPLSHVERQQRVEAFAPMAEMMANNPEMLRSLLVSQGINPDHPQVKMMLEDKEMVKNMIMSSVDPDAQRALQHMDLQIAQLGATQEGSFFVNAAMEQARNDSGLFTEVRKSAVDLHPATEAHSRPNPSQNANNEVLPNPWADAPPLASTAPFGRMPGMPGMPSPFGQGLMPSWTSGPQLDRPVPEPVVNEKEPSPTARPAPNMTALRNLYSEQLRQLQSFGFEDDSLCLEALAASNGDIGDKDGRLSSATTPPSFCLFSLSGETVWWTDTQVIYSGKLNI